MKKILILLSLLAFVPVAGATEKTTKCVDKEGKILITDEPCSSAGTSGMSVVAQEKKPGMSNTPPPATVPQAAPPPPPTPAKSAAEPVRKPNQPAN